MSAVKIIAIGDNVCDKYLSRGKMYPGGQCVNTCAYAAANGVPSAYLGKFGSDEVAAYNQKILHELGIDISHCRHFEGENGFAMVTLKGNDRVFLGSNKGGVAKEHSFDFTQEDLEYIKGFNLIYTNLNSYIEEDLPFLHTAGVPIAYDFSTRWTDAYLEKVCPYVTVAILSCAHLSAEDRAREMQKAADHGVSIVLGTIGEDGSYVLYNGKTYYASAVHADDVIDTMGAWRLLLCCFPLLAAEVFQERRSAGRHRRRKRRASAGSHADRRSICCKNVRQGRRIRLRNPHRGTH